MRERRIILSVIWIIIGAILIGLAFAGKVDSFWNGMGSTLFLIGILQVLRFRRFNKNAEYREKVEIAESDERNHFIRGKAWAWTGYIFILATSVAVIVLKIMGQEILMQMAAVSVCFMLTIYWISYYILKRKY